MPQGGFGNLIALPLQKRPRREGNSVFLDDQFVPWADQWACLASARRISRAQVERILSRGRAPRSHPRRALAAAGRWREEPWAAPRHRGTERSSPIVGGLPQTLDLVLGNQI
jgi:hypothetical protein